MLQVLLLLAALTLNPYWHVPKLAAMTTITSEADGTVSLTCDACGETVQTWTGQPTLTDLIEAAKGHKHTRP